MGRLEKGIPAPTQKESIFVLGVAPDNHRVMIFPGSTDTGFFAQNQWLPAAFYGGAEGGFIVGKAKAGSTLAITDVRVTKVASQYWAWTSSPVMAQRHWCSTRRRAK